MKKLKLKLEGKEMLTKQQMRKVSGGYCMGGADPVRVTCCQDNLGNGCLPCMTICGETWFSCGSGPFAYYGPYNC